MEKLNHKVVIAITKYERETLDKITNQLGISLNFLCRSLINSKIQEIKLVGIENFNISLSKVTKTTQK